MMGTRGKIRGGVSDWNYRTTTGKNDEGKGRPPAVLHRTPPILSPFALALPSPRPVCTLGAGFWTVPDRISSLFFYDFESFFRHIIIWCGLPVFPPASIRAIKLTRQPLNFDPQQEQMKRAREMGWKATLVGPDSPGVSGFHFFAVLNSGVTVVWQISKTTWRQLRQIAT